MIRPSNLPRTGWISGGDLLRELPLFQVVNLMGQGLKAETDDGKEVYPIQWEPEERQRLCLNQLAIDEMSRQRGQAGVPITSIESYETRYIIDLESPKIKEQIATFWFSEKDVEDGVKPLTEGETVQKLGYTSGTKGRSAMGSQWVSWHDLIQAHPLFVIFKALKDGRLKAVHKLTGKALSYPWEFYEYSAILEDKNFSELDKDVMRRLEEIVDSEPGLSEKPAQQLYANSCLLENNAVFSAREVDQVFSRGPSSDDELSKEYAEITKAARPNVTKRWDALADVKRKNPNMTAKQLRERKDVIAQFGGLPPKEDRIRRRLKKDYGLSFS